MELMQYVVLWYQGDSLNRHCFNARDQATEFLDHLHGMGYRPILKIVPFSVKPEELLYSD